MTLTWSSRGAGSSEWPNSMPHSTEPTFSRGSKYPFITALGFLFVGFSAVPFASSVRIPLALIGLTQFLLGMIGWVFLDKLERYPPGPDQPWSEDGGLYPAPSGPRDGEPRPPHARPSPIRWRALDESHRMSRLRPGSGIRRPYRRMGTRSGVHLAASKIHRSGQCERPCHLRAFRRDFVDEPLADVGDASDDAAHDLARAGLRHVGDGKVAAGDINNDLG